MNYFDNIAFQGVWRDYQTEILKNFDKHISDDHFHIIAPPGSGKTILGIEVVKRLNKKTLILAPTLTIRNQWAERLQTFFTLNQDFTDISFDIKKPKSITVSTYQALFSYAKSFEFKNGFLEKFNKKGIEVLVLDEAHHLKNEWWKILNQLKANQQQKIVALTATPPYDSSSSEINKYFSLCGEIDDEITVPELVRNQDLCPHHDLVVFSVPEQKEIDSIVQFRKKVSSVYQEITSSSEWLKRAKEHRFYLDTENCLDEIYQSPQYFSALLIFLNAQGVSIPKEKLEFLGINPKDKIEFPLWDIHWAEILLQHILIKDRANYEQEDEFLNHWTKKLKQNAIYRKNKIDFVGSQFLYKSLSRSSSKLKSIAQIVTHEKENLKDQLRCVVLTDYIRKEQLDTDAPELEMGVAPIFIYLKNQLNSPKDLAILCGTMVVIHKEIIAQLPARFSLSADAYSPLKKHPDYVQINPNEQQKKRMVALITELLNEGLIKILVGTQSLLGEGWDCPAVNSLILATSVRSFVSSNQMRGRALRIDSNHKDKVGLIWHLACLDYGAENRGEDYQFLCQRFQTFTGVHDNENLICNGIHRLHFHNKIKNQKQLSTTNQFTFSIAENRTEIQKKWKQSIGNGGEIRQIFEYNPSLKQQKKWRNFYFKDVVYWSFVELSLALVSFFMEFVLNNIGVLFRKGILYFIYSLFAALFLSFGWRLYVSVKQYLRFGFVHKKMHKMGQVIVKSMQELNLLQTPIEKLNIECHKMSDGIVNFYVSGASAIENQLITNSIEELLAPIDNPKYLINKNNFLRNQFHLESYFPLPDIFSKKKKEASIFIKHWNQHLGKHQLVYTRNPEGRKILIKARLYNLHQFKKEISKKEIVWK